MTHVQTKTQKKETFRTKFKHLTGTQKIQACYLIDRLKQGKAARQSEEDKPTDSDNKDSDQLITVFVILFSLMQSGLMDVAISIADGFT